MFARRLLSSPQLRLAARQMRPAALPIRRYATQPPNMAELESLMQSDPSLRDMMEKLSRRPSAIAAVQEIGDLVQKKGFKAGQMPTKMDFLKLMMDSEFRAAAQKLSQEMQEAGVDVNPEVFAKMMGGGGSN